MKRIIIEDEWQNVWEISSQDILINNPDSLILLRRMFYVGFAVCMRSITNDNDCSIQEAEKNYKNLWTQIDDFFKDEYEKIKTMESH